jgi:hypothetical protein
MRTLALLLGLVCLDRTVAAQPASGPIALLLPASARAAAVASAIVAVRDDYSVFVNPAQISNTSGFGFSLSRYAPGAVRGSVASATTVGQLTFGWGVQYAEFRSRTDSRYPLAPAALTEHGRADGLSLNAIAGANMLIKGIRTGAGVKYTQDRVSIVRVGNTFRRIRNRLVLFDVGASRPLLSGTAALAVQNIGDRGAYRTPLQGTIGYSRGRTLGEFDLGLAASITQRDHWTSPAGGIELGYGWIEGWSVALRGGARRPETSQQRPITLGAGLTADRLVADYGVEFFAHDRLAHHLTLRWR